ncbi:hypothetical protein BN873_150144 [Candidatus Competibacter denitrificans Run_A_D11]|uniref:Uncharacterized protein n=1 Tax=Candidatus Competibacter denitrificans Run_A_D11 TaxID=1400863 RepID=W6M1Q0_9GAMM|nr:hypothetical protein BN873_150144 [Candidatus Competibacter denitrificans Run_A_D11]
MWFSGGLENRHHIKTTGQVQAVALQVKGRRTQQPLLLAAGDRFGGRAELAGTAAAHFDEHQLTAIAQDQVQFAATTAKIARHQGESPRFQIAQRQILGSGSLRNAADQRRSPTADKRRVKKQAALLNLMSIALFSPESITVTLLSLPRQPNDNHDTRLKHEFIVPFRTGYGSARTLVGALSLRWVALRRNV